MNLKESVMSNYNDEYQEIFEATCCLLKTFNGKDGKAIVQEVTEIMKSSSAMRRFMFDFYYNLRAISCSD